MEIFIPIYGTINSLELAQIFISHVFSKHGLPVSIVSNRGSLFFSSFWTNLFQQLKISRDLSTAFHPETDQQTERVNPILEQYPCMYVSYCNNHSSGVRAFILTPTQTPQTSKSTVCMRVQLQKYSLLKHAYSLVHQYSLSIFVQVGINQYRLDTPFTNCMITQYHHSSCTDPVHPYGTCIGQTQFNNDLFP
ncbi:hypothetical protein O181_048096 [Austropuccinia psidii MF-1]|uniref:Integrase catalytic domain-containing protein n=1 Tax=Austropuccinia psidii MF-1 TaxID=1389203 RepID=A0A9Q3DQ16_9BASI|nr:hypothetical protein [Austropuccinia psidii MF-1]